ncbi:MAG: tRNA threonylcarbamoyl adenosine modification protein (Sua5/YciO/YrdC/YwlC family) [Gammaproteobacteria bacterium]|jgi:tRNA threonylcarbamoyl adenosine modification protein (Sua5/YciO/YrdC/YwlC family)
MAQYFEIHPDNPQQRLIQQAVSIIDRGGLIIYPTDSSYALGCHIGDKTAMERIQRIRRTDSKHHFTLVCSDLSEIGTYAKLSNTDYRLMKALTPGPYTFLLPATSVVPRRLMNPKRKTIGVRVPDNNIALAILEQLGQPIMSSTLIPAGEDQALDGAQEIREAYEHDVDLVIDGGFCGVEPTTVVNLIEGYPEIMRYGKGDVSFLD